MESIGAGADMRKSLRTNDAPGFPNTARSSLEPQQARIHFVLDSGQRLKGGHVHAVSESPASTLKQDHGSNLGMGEADGDPGCIWVAWSSSLRGTAALGATYAFSQSPLSCASRSFRGPIFKGSSGSILRVRK
jgi:hypothetical protein